MTKYGTERVREADPKGRAEKLVGISLGLGGDRVGLRRALAVQRTR